MVRYAEAYDYGLFWCNHDGLWSGYDTAAAASRTYFEDAAVVDWVSRALPIGAPLMNMTTGTYGRVVSRLGSRVNTTNLWRPRDQYSMLKMSAEEATTIETFLTLSAPTMGVALQASGMDACAKSAAGDAYLRQLNVIMAAIVSHCPCGRAVKLSAEERNQWLVWLTERLSEIRTNAIELCQGETGSDFPAFGVVEQGWTPAVEARIIFNREQRNNP